MNLLDRFAAKIATDDNDCLIWLGGHTQTRPNSDYGLMRVEGRSRVAHHVAWFLEYGRWPAPDMELDHLCRVTLCVNVHHLEEVTRQVNNQRRKMGWTNRPDPAYCMAGLHPWVPANHYYKSGSPTCKRCELDRAKERYRRKVGAPWSTPTS
jgi:hypothetical protein